MNTIAAVNAPRGATLAGKTFQVSALTMADWGKVQAWVAANVPGPMEVLRSADVDAMSPYAARTLMLVAMKEQRNWPPKVGTADWFDALDRTGKDGKDGNAVFLHAILARHQPDLTHGDAVALADAASPAEVGAVMALAFGREPADPKASPPADPAGTPSG